MNWLNRLNTGEGGYERIDKDMLGALAVVCVIILGSALLGWIWMK